MDLGSLAVQQAGHHQSISSVVPFSAEDGDGLAARRSVLCFQLLDDSLAGPLHQGGARNLRLSDRAAIEQLHLGSGHDVHRWPCIWDRSPMKNRGSGGRKEICGLRRNVMARGSHVVLRGDGYPSNAFISLTAWSRPTRTARAMMLWPMLYSTISGMFSNRAMLR